MKELRVKSLSDTLAFRDVAQPGLERCVRDAEVAGSNPVIPTNFFSMENGEWKMENGELIFVRELNQDFTTDEHRLTLIKEIENGEWKMENCGFAREKSMEQGLAR